MKQLKYILGLAIILSNLGCDEEVVLYDFEKYKFVSFVDIGDEIQETYSEDNDSGYPIYLRYDGSVLEEDFTVELAVRGNNLQEGTNFSVDSKKVLFKAGEIRSEPFLINIIDDLVNSSEDRSLEITIESVSNSKIDIGVGIVNQSNKLFVLNVLDNECSDTTAVFNSSNILNSAGDHIVSGNVEGSEVTLNGTLINYVAFPNAELEITLTPVIAGATTGSASFVDYPAGTDNDGYVYQFRQNGEGTYDVCLGEISVVIDVYYESGGAWVFWFTSTNTYSLQE
nr:hypothetical protein [Allomuricauda sp.]